ncbi:MAG: nucleotidyltransferase domain-containing protein [Firmicutes bacterium]|nr:nucleotidyltransferase domain-containing protein [Bacillota bacterium]
MNKNYEEELRGIIKAFGENGILENIIIIGSWATYFYVKIFDGFIPSIRTLDVDCYVPMNKNITVKKSVKEALKPLNYEQIFDTSTEKNKFISPDGFEIEFLTKLRRNQSAVVRIDSMGVNAETLGNLDIFDNGFIEVDFEGFSVKVASPSVYVMQKILISKKRSDEKFRKDLESLLLVYEEIKKNELHMSQYMTLVNSLGKGTKKTYNDYINNNNLAMYK